MSTLSRDYEYGRIVSVDVITLGDNLAADAAAGATTITVEDAADFDEDGGSLLLNDVVYTYTACDDDTGIISGLDPVLAAAAVEGDDVSVWDPLYLTTQTDKVAQVAVIGDDGAVDMLECAVALHLVDKLVEGVRGGRGESVKIELDGGEWLVVDIGGLSDQSKGLGGTNFKIDPFTVSAPGAQALALTYVPLPESHHLYWNGQEQEGAYTIDGQIARIDLTQSATLEVGDDLVVKYAYRVGADLSASASAIVPLECSTMTVTKPTYSAAYVAYDGDWWFWTRDMTFRLTWKPAVVYPLKAVGYYVFRKMGDLTGYPYRTQFEGAWDSSAHGIAPAGLDYGLGVNGGAAFPNPTVGGSPAGVEMTVVANPRLSFGSSSGPPPPDLDMELIGFGYMVPVDENAGYLPQVHEGGRVGLTDPSQCMWYWGQKIAETDDDRDEPIGGV